METRDDVFVFAFAVLREIDEKGTKSVSDVFVYVKEKKKEKVFKKEIRS